MRSSRSGSRARKATGRCADRLAPFNGQKDTAIVDALPRNATGKVLERELRQRFVEKGAMAIG